MSVDTKVLVTADDSYAGVEVNSTDATPKA